MAGLACRRPSHPEGAQLGSAWDESKALQSSNIQHYNLILFRLMCLREDLWLHTSIHMCMVCTGDCKMCNKLTKKWSISSHLYLYGGSSETMSPIWMVLIGEMWSTPHLVHSTLSVGSESAISCAPSQPHEWDTTHTPRTYSKDHTQRKNTLPPKSWSHPDYLISVQCHMLGCAIKSGRHLFTSHNAQDTQTNKVTFPCTTPSVSSNRGMHLAAGIHVWMRYKPEGSGYTNITGR